MSKAIEAPTTMGNAVPSAPRRRLSQRAMLRARKVAKAITKRMNADVDYDLRMYEAIAGLRQWNPDDVVLDVGANDGRTIFRIQWHLPSPRIHAFEPVSATFDTLSERTGEFANVTCHRLGMGAEPGEATIYLTERSVLNSLYPQWGALHGYHDGGSPQTEQVSIETLDRFVDANGIDRVQFLKVDAEGHDLEVLKGADECLRDGRIDIIQVEAGFGVPGRQQPTLTQFQEYLTGFGYYLHGIYNQCCSTLAQLTGNDGSSTADGSPPLLIFCDALFVRTALGRNGPDVH